MDVLAQVNWEGVGVCISIVLATGLTGVMVRDKAKAKRQRATDVSDRDNAAVVLKDACDERHLALGKLMDERKEYLEHRFDDLKVTVEAGFVRIEKALNGRKT